MSSAKCLDASRVPTYSSSEAVIRTHIVTVRWTQTVTGSAFAARHTKAIAGGCGHDGTRGSGLLLEEFSLHAASCAHEDSGFLNRWLVPS